VVFWTISKLARLVTTNKSVFGSALLEQRANQFVQRIMPADVLAYYLDRAIQPSPASGVDRAGGRIERLMRDQRVKGGSDSALGWRPDRPPDVLLENRRNASHHNTPQPRPSR